MHPIVWEFLSVFSVCSSSELKGAVISHMTMEIKKVVLVLMMLFAGVYYLGRIGIFYLGATGEMAFEEEQSALVEGIVVYSFLAIGVAGLFTLPGVYLHRTWGFWGTVAISAYTIAFDIWALAAVQSSAAAGVVPAAVLLGYVVLTRKEFMMGTGKPAG